MDPTPELTIPERPPMRRSASHLDELVPLSPAAFHILLALVDGDRHGYAVMQEVEERTAGRVRLGPGTLYGAIKRLRGQGMIEELEERAAQGGGDERRRYYHLTPRGRAVAKLEAERLERLVETARAMKLIRAPRPA